MHFIDKGLPPKGGKYLVCDVSKRLKTCPAKAVRYDEFEYLFFDNFEELDIDQLIPGKDETQIRLNDLERKLTANRQQILEINTMIENLTDTISITRDNRVREQYDKRLSRLFDDRERLEAESKEYDREITGLRQQKTELESNAEQVKEVYRLMETAKNEKERIELRLRLRQQIQKTLYWIKIYPLQKASPCY